MVQIKKPKEKVEHLYTYLSTTSNEKDGEITIRLLNEKEESITKIYIDESESLAIAKKILDDYGTRNGLK